MKLDIARLIVVGFVFSNLCWANEVDDYVFGQTTLVEDPEVFLDFIAASVGQVLLFKVQVPGCAACLALAPKLTELAAENPDIIFINVNYMTAWPVLLEYNVTVVPTCILVYNKVENGRVMTTRKEVVQDQINKTRTECANI